MIVTIAHGVTQLSNRMHCQINKRLLSCRRLVQQDADREQIRPVVNVVLVAVKLLWGEIVGCSDPRALKRLREIRQSEVPGESEVDDDGGSVRANAHVLGLNVAMNDPLLSERGEPIAQLGEKLNRFLEGPRLA